MYQLAADAIHILSRHLHLFGDFFVAEILVEKQGEDFALSACFRNVPDVMLDVEEGIIVGKRSGKICIGIVDVFGFRSREIAFAECIVAINDRCFDIADTFSFRTGGIEMCQCFENGKTQFLECVLIVHTVNLSGIFLCEWHHTFQNFFTGIGRTVAIFFQQLRNCSQKTYPLLGGSRELQSNRKQNSEKI